MLERTTLELSRMPAEVQLTLESYVEEQGLDQDRLTRADLILALLRINTPGSLKCAEALLGKPVVRCPPCIPVWPPKPVAKKPYEPKVTAVGHNPCSPTTDAYRRFRLIRRGMTRTEIRAQGVSNRDLNYWIKQGHLEIR